MLDRFPCNVSNACVIVSHTHYWRITLKQFYSKNTSISIPWNTLKFLPYKIHDLQNYFIFYKIFSGRVIFLVHERAYKKPCVSRVTFLNRSKSNGPPLFLGNLKVMLLKFKTNWRVKQTNKSELRGLKIDCCETTLYKNQG